MRAEGPVGIIYRKWVGLFQKEEQKLQKHGGPQESGKPNQCMKPGRDSWLGSRRKGAGELGRWAARLGRVYRPARPECSPKTLEWTARGTFHKYMWIARGMFYKYTPGCSTETTWDGTRQETGREVGRLL